MELNPNYSEEVLLENRMLQVFRKIGEVCREDLEIMLEKARGYWSVMSEEEKLLVATFLFRQLVGCIGKECVFRKFVYEQLGFTENSGAYMLLALQGGSEVLEVLAKGRM